jgi:ribonuclease D
MEALKAEKIAVEARLGMKADEATKELALLETRKSQNERQLKAYEDITKMIEKGITDATKQNIDARMVEYRREEAKLNDLIRLRMMAGMSIPTPVAPVTNNNVTNAPTVNVNAQVSQNVDVNYIGQELSRQLLLSNKGIN